MAYIGVDLHTNFFTICRLETDGSEQFETFQLCANDLERFCLRLSADDELAIEATGNSAYFRDEVISCVGRIVVVNPRLTQTRDLLVKQRTRLLNKIHALFNRHGIKIKKEKFTSKRSLERINMDVFSKVERIEITLVRDQALSLTQAIKDADVEIERFAASLDGFEGLLIIKGIGSRTAAIFLSAIGNVNDFEDENKLAAYFCIVPRVSQSNETDHRGRITKRGNKLVRTALVQCSLIAIRYSGYLNSYYHRIKGRRGSGKAIIATARKLLKIIYDTLKNGWIFKDFTTFTLAENKVPAGQTS